MPSGHRTATISSIVPLTSDEHEVELYSIPEFSNVDEAHASIELIWSKHYTNNDESGKKVYYRCKKSKVRGIQCRAANHDYVEVEEVRGINEDIKPSPTYRERHVLSRFLTISPTIVNHWSIECDSSSTNVKVFATESTISLRLWTSSDQWAKTTEEIICIQNDVSKQYYIPARNLQSISQADLKRCIKQKWTSFKLFEKSYDVWCLEMMDALNWKTSRCSCPAFLKDYICKHMVGMAIRLKISKPPAAAKAIPINSKRKRGRPTKNQTCISGAIIQL
ncbi:unnamed protein product [Adineta steineri]|uniref:SWIM-type domain-containing protein n=1 Tax=Adineta steineri TaxID=433720 RepID=A0A819CCL5_9BILA|nr:unnamed protein product [Adineta steineri]CAF3817145.1 unnamed protein product [Adineta steineri]